MSKNINFTINLDGNIYTGLGNINKALNTVNASVSSSLKFFDKLSNSIFKINTIASGIQSVQSAIGGITEAGANAELQLMNLKTLFGGNAEAANDMYERISEYGKVTPYDKAGLIEAQRTMMSFGIEGEKAFKTLKQIGDIAMGDKQKMQSLALAFAQMSSTGKLTGQDLMQMVNAGFNPLQEISKQTGKSVADLKKEMEKGAVSVGMVEAAFQSATSEGGLFHNAIAEASETTAGKMAAIQDTIEEVKVAIFNATGDFGLWVDAAAQVALPIAQLSPLFSAIGGSIKWTKKQWDKFRKAVRKGTVSTCIDLGFINTAIVATGAFFKGLAATAKVACKAIGTAIKNIPIIGWIAAAIAAVIALFQLLWERCEGFRRLLFGLWEVIKAISSHLWSVFKEGVAYVWSIVKPMIDAIKNYVSSLWASIVEGATLLWQKVVGIATRIGEFFMSVWTWISSTASEAFNFVVENLSLLWQHVVETATRIGEFFVGVWTWISSTASEAFNFVVARLAIVGSWISERLVKPIKQAFSSVWTVIKDVFNKIIDGLGRLFEPIRKLWNKIFPKDAFEKIGDAYKIGADKGSESWQNDQKAKAEGDVFPDISVLNPNIGTAEEKKSTKNKINADLTGGSLGSSAGTSAGKAQQVNITLESMVQTMNFNGSFDDNSHNVEQKLREMMARILGMAETAI